MSPDDSRGKVTKKSAPTRGRPLVNRELKDRRKEVAFPDSLLTSLEQMAKMEATDVNKVVRRACEKEVNRLPVLGAIPCGSLADVFEEVFEEWVNVGDTLRVKQGDFLLRCFGDSMTGDHIEDGDLVQIRPQENCDNNEIAAVMVDTPFGWQATLKRVRYEVGSTVVTLQPMNAKHKPIRIDTTNEELRICGVFKGLVRRR
jgi:SOS-response transcriptional repressor LexA